MEWNKTIRTNITNTPPSSSSPSSLLPPFCLPETKEGETSGASGVAWRHCSVGSGRPVAPSSSSRSINRDLINARFLGPLPVHFRFTSGSLPVSPGGADTGNRKCAEQQEEEEEENFLVEMLRVPLDGWIDRISRRMSSGYVTPEVSLERYRKPEIRSDETAIRSDSIRTIRNRWEGGR